MTVLNSPIMSAPLDEDLIRDDFPILKRDIHGNRLVFLDSAASAQKPKAVLNAIEEAYRGHYANVHRGLHTLSEEATESYERTRDKIARLINASSRDEVVMTGGATIALNIIAQSWASRGKQELAEGDEILISVADHHANIVPWQMVAQRTGAKLIVAPVEPDGSIPMDAVATLITERTKIVSMPHVSNVLGTVFDVRKIADLAHQVGAIFVCDGCQGIVHLPVDVQALGCDFYVFAGHKFYGPTGIGAFWGRAELLKEMPPLLGGGDMIERVTIEKTTYADPPNRFEAGTPPFVQAVGLGAAIDYVTAIGMEAICAHEQSLLTYGHQRLSAVKGIKLIGTAARKSGVISFTMDGAHPHDIAAIVDRKGVAIRAGHHCAMPLHDFLGLAATTRASIGVYSQKSDFDALAESLEVVRGILA